MRYVVLKDRALGGLGRDRASTSISGNLSPNHAPVVSPTELEFSHNSYTFPNKHGTSKGVLYRLLPSLRVCFSGAMLVWRGEHTMSEPRTKTSNVVLKQRPYFQPCTAGSWIVMIPLIFLHESEKTQSYRRALLVGRWHGAGKYKGLAKYQYPNPWADPKSRSTLGFYNLPIGVLDSRIGGSTFWIFAGVWVSS